MSNDPCLEPAYAEWGTQDLTAAQRKRLQRTSTVGGGTPNKATLTLATEPENSDDEFWKEAASIAGELERAHQNVRGTTAKVKRKRQQQQSGNSTKTAKNRQAEKKAETECSESHNSTQTATKNKQAEAAGTTDNSTKTAKHKQAEAAGAHVVLGSVVLGRKPSHDDSTDSSQCHRRPRVLVATLAQPSREKCGTSCHKGS